MPTPILPALVLLTLSSAAAQDAVELPRGPGLAARYPGDRGVAGDPSVLLAEDFELESVAELTRRWSDVKDPGGVALALVPDGPPGSSGTRALRVTALPEENTGGHLYANLDRRVARAYARFYVYFPEGAGYVHHFVDLGGYSPPTRWPQGGAGVRPEGDDRVTVAIEPHCRGGALPPPGEWSFYTYWQGMKRSADGRYWGNAIAPVEPRRVPVGRWQCVEILVALGVPGMADGELALWLDGEPVMHVRSGTPRGPWSGMGFRLPEEDELGGEPFEGFDFRKSEELLLSFFWLKHYVTPGALERCGVRELAAPNRVLFDHVVVATEYVGPLVPATDEDD